MLSKEEKKKFDQKIKADKEARAIAIKKLEDDYRETVKRNNKIAVSQIPFLEKTIKDLATKMKKKDANLADLSAKKKKFEEKLNRYKQLL